MKDGSEVNVGNKRVTEERRMWGVFITAYNKICNVFGGALPKS
jgi:hypothetical protein